MLFWRWMECGRVTEKMNVEHRTSNIELFNGGLFFIQGWAFDVQCSTFILVSFTDISPPSATPKEGHPAVNFILPAHPGFGPKMALRVEKLQPSTVNLINFPISFPELV
jgi:hypothetical protein